MDPGLPTAFWYAEVEFETEAEALAWDPAAAGLGGYLSDECTGKPGPAWGNTGSRPGAAKLEPTFMNCKIVPPCFTNGYKAATIELTYRRQKSVCATPPGRIFMRKEEL